MTPNLAPQFEAGRAEAEIDVDQIRADTESVEVGDYPQSADEYTLCRYLRRRAQLIDERERIHEQMTAMLKEKDASLRGLDYVYIPLVAPIVARMIEGRKQKSIKTPWGTAGFRTSGQKLVVVDEEKLIEFAYLHREIICIYEVKTSIIKSKLDEYVKQTGEIPDGVEAVPPMENFYAK